MLKQAIAIISLSLITILCVSYAQQVIQALVTTHDWAAILLADIFSGGPSGKIARGLIALLLVPLLIGLLPALFYYAIRRHWFPYFMEIIWIVWLLQMGALIMVHKAVI